MACYYCDCCYAWSTFNNALTGSFRGCLWPDVGVTASFRQQQEQQQQHTEDTEIKIWVHEENETVKHEQAVQQLCACTINYMRNISTCKANWLVIGNMALVRFIHRTKMSCACSVFDYLVTTTSFLFLQYIIYWDDRRKCKEVNTQSAVADVRHEHCQRLTPVLTCSKAAEYLYYRTLRNESSRFAEVRRSCHEIGVKTVWEII